MGRVRFFSVLAALVFVACFAVSARAASDEETGHAAQVTFHFEDARLQPAVYTVVVDESGAGRYESTLAAGQAAQSPSDAREITVPPSIVNEIFSAARQHRLFAITCEDGKGKIAFQGRKSLSYHGPDGSGSCEYNWSKDTQIQQLTNTFLAIGYTLEEGRRIASLHEHDRLGLDAELGQLLDEAKAGRASALSNIRPELEAVAEDGRVMARARGSARQLLRMAQAE